MFPKQRCSQCGNVPKARLCSGFRGCPECVGIRGRGSGCFPWLSPHCFGCLGAGSPALLLHAVALRSPQLWGTSLHAGKPTQRWQREEARTSIPCPRSHQRSRRGGTSCPRSPASSRAEHPIHPCCTGMAHPGDSHSGGVRAPQSGAGSPAAGRDRSLLGKGRRARRKAPYFTSRSRDLC